MKLLGHWIMFRHTPYTYIVIILCINLETTGKNVDKTWKLVVTRCLQSPSWCHFSCDWSHCTFQNPKNLTFSCSKHFSLPISIASLSIRPNFKDLPQFLAAMAAMASCEGPAAFSENVHLIKDRKRKSEASSKISGKERAQLICYRICRKLDKFWVFHM